MTRETRRGSARDGEGRFQPRRLAKSFRGDAAHADENLIARASIPANSNASIKFESFFIIEGLCPPDDNKEGEKGDWG